jgi:hypothetical protein
MSETIEIIEIVEKKKGWLWYHWAILIAGIILFISFVVLGYKKANSNPPTASNTTSQEETVVEKKTVPGDSAKSTESQEKNESETQALNIDPEDIIETPLGDEMNEQAKHARKSTRTITRNDNGTLSDTLVLEW